MRQTGNPAGRISAFPNSRSGSGRPCRLTRACQYAQELRCDPWQFAVAIGDLTRYGLAASDLQWLVMKGFLDHAREVTRISDHSRRFKPGQNLAFSERSHFVLTDSGIAFVLRKFSIATVAPLLVESTVTARVSKPTTAPPTTAGGDSLLGNQQVKRYRGRASCQETVLAAFEEEGWPEHMAIR